MERMSEDPGGCESRRRDSGMHSGRPNVTFYSVAAQTIPAPAVIPEPLPTAPPHPIGQWHADFRPFSHQNTRSTPSIMAALARRKYPQSCPHSVCLIFSNISQLQRVCAR